VKAEKVVLASFALWPCIGPYGKQGFRVPHGWDALTALFVQIGTVFMHKLSNLPSCMFGTNWGAFSNRLPFPADPALMGAEIRYASYDTSPSRPMSASFMVTYF
jgi:hypothetical protein